MPVARQMLAGSTKCWIAITIAGESASGGITAFSGEVWYGPHEGGRSVVSPVSNVNVVMTVGFGAPAAGTWRTTSGRSV